MTAVATLGASNEEAGDEVVVEVEDAEHWHRRALLNSTSTPAPAWLQDDTTLRGERLVVPEWEHQHHHHDHENPNTYRHKNGWHGRDLVHDLHSPVRITDYFVEYGAGTDIMVAAEEEDAAIRHSNNDSNNNAAGGDDSCQAAAVARQRGGAGTVLRGIVEFTPAAESHRGFCHGGSMCSVMDDVVGWTGFCCSGTVRPWTGFTVQVNTALQKPVPVASVLLVEGRITRVERRKVYVTATLYDPANENAVHATTEGMVVLNRGVLRSAEEQQQQRQQQEEPQEEVQEDE